MDNTNNAASIIGQILTQDKLIKMTISGPLNKDADYFKISVEPKKEKNILFYQVSFFFETKVKHSNYFDAEALTGVILSCFTKYKQTDILTHTENYKIFVNKNGSYKIINRPANVKAASEIKPHNNVKNYIIPDGTAVNWLQRLGVMNGEGTVLAQKQKKFRQINHFLKIIEDVSGLVPGNANIIDIGCGKSYLTFALHYYLNELKHKNVRITGLDLKQDVVENCQAYADEFGFNNLHFYARDIETFELDGGQADMVVSLHACDTATDYALFNAVKWGAEVILCVPCCQHELYDQIKNSAMQPLLKHGILKERFAAILTDTLRALLLEAYGYKCTVMEFIDMEHTPKNIMIRAIKKQPAAFNRHAFEQYIEISSMYGVTPTLLNLLKTLQIKKSN